ncbi:hypothetical protein [Rhodanobacter geophilus]|uniref:Uncharacterized protein n=1 Tax=Rhodanobacter geophilus TaxID=3162488 RepID=A0ABV3QTD6_9GAMM
MNAKIKLAAIHGRTLQKKGSSPEAAKGRPSGHRWRDVMSPRAIFAGTNRGEPGQIE